MFNPSRHLWQIAAGLTLLAGALNAAPTQTAPAPPVTPPAAAPPPAPADPQAKAVLDQAVAAHKALTALSVTLALQTVGTGADQSQTVTLAFGNGLGAKAAIADKTGPLAQLVSDGKTLTIYDVHAKKYLARPLPAGTPATAAVLRSARSLLAQLLAQPEDLAQILAQPGVAASVGVPATVSGVTTDTVTATLPSPNGGSRSVFVFAVGHDDHLLRQVTETISVPAPAGGPARTLTHTETVTALSASPTLVAADFAFTPPPGVKAVAPATASSPKAAVPAEPTMHDPRLVKGAQPFAIATKDLSGKPLSLAQYKGKVVLMDFWATWCPPCVGEMPNVIAAYKKYHAQGFDVLGISLDEDKGALTKFIAQNKMPWRQVFDGKGWGSVVPNRYGVRSIPFGLLVGRDGKITAVEVRGPDLGPAIQKALAAKTVAAR